LSIKTKAMRSFALTLFICLAGMMANAQVQFNIFGGPNVTTAGYRVESTKQNTSVKYGFQLGMGAKVVFDNQLYFAPAAFYSMKGYKVKFTNFAFPPSPDATDNNTTFHTFELAFLLQYDFNNNPDHFFLKVGPTLDFQVFGKEKFNTPTGMVDRKTPFGYDKYGHYSANALVQFGYEMKNGFFFFGQYSHGLGDINNADGGPSIRHKGFGISIGKMLGKNKIVIDTKNKE
jgi:hypothetical protein